MPETLLVSRRRRRGGRLAHSIVCATRGRCCRTYRLRHHLNKAKATERPSLGSSEGRGSGPDFSASLAELTAAFDAKVFSSTTHSDAALNALEELGKLVPRGNLGHRAEGGAPVSTYVEGPTRDTLKEITWDLITFSASLSRVPVAAVWPSGPGA